MYKILIFTIFLCPLLNGKSSKTLLFEEIEKKYNASVIGAGGSDSGRISVYHLEIGTPISYDIARNIVLDCVNGFETKVGISRDLLKFLFHKKNNEKNDSLISGMTFAKGYVEYDISLEPAFEEHFLTIHKETLEEAATNVFNLKDADFLLAREVAINVWNTFSQYNLARKEPGSTQTLELEIFQLELLKKEFGAWLDVANISIPTREKVIYDIATLLPICNSIISKISSLKKLGMEPFLKFKNLDFNYYYYQPKAHYITGKIALRNWVKKDEPYEIWKRGNRIGLIYSSVDGGNKPDENITKEVEDLILKLNEPAPKPVESTTPNV